MQTSRILNTTTALSFQQNFLERVNAVITKNLSNEAFTVSDLPVALSLSNAQIYRKIKQETGCSPSVYIRNMRLRYAQELVLHSDLSLSEITYLVGFSTLSYFSRCFSNFYGICPSKLRA